MCPTQISEVGAFGNFLQFDAVANNVDIGFQSLDNENYSQSATIGGQATLTFAVPATLRADLANSKNPTQIIIQVGGGYSYAYANQTTNPVVYETFYIDNLRVNNLPGDFNFDGHVNADDIPAMLKALTDVKTFEATNSLSAADMLALGDFDMDQQFTNADILGFLSFLQAGNGSLASVSEPASLVLLGWSLPGLALLAHRRSRSSVPNEASARSSATGSIFRSSHVSRDDNSIGRKYILAAPGHSLLTLVGGCKMCLARE